MDRLNNRFGKSTNLLRKVDLEVDLDMLEDSYDLSSHQSNIQVPTKDAWIN